jgi:hypothetical protein
MSDGTFNPAKRRLCPDGSCIGVLGDDGRCRTCGRGGDGSAATGASDAAWNADDDDDDDSLAADGRDAAGAGDAASAGETAGAGDAGGGAFRPDRRLCDDGSCVGVIGEGNVCSVCGRPAGS